jgi:hypothetical protein
MKLLLGTWASPYLQTWNLVPFRPRWLRRLIRRVCGKLGHDPSRTEYGYGGGQFVDRWCRWCGQQLQEQFSTSEWAKDNAQLCGAVGYSFSQAPVESTTEVTAGADSSIDLVGPSGGDSG